MGYDPFKRAFLTKGFSEGFYIPFEGDITEGMCRNHKSALQKPSVVDEKLRIELEAGRVSGPFDHMPLEHLIVSPIGLVPKKEPGLYRLIHDLSAPKGASVNDCIPKEFCTVQYETLDDVISHVLVCGPGSLISKVDIKDAFRICPIHPTCHSLLGFSWRDQFYIDQTKFHAMHITHILDDFIMISPPQSPAAHLDLKNFHKMAKSINVPIKDSKTCLPSTCAIVHGVEIDTVNMETRLPLDKLEKARHQLSQVVSKRRITPRTLQYLIGFLNFACKVIVPRRPFLRRLIDLTKGIRHRHHHVTITAESHADIFAWQDFLENHNGKALMLDYHWQSSQKLSLFSDAAGSVGFAAYFGSHWFAGKCMDLSGHNIYGTLSNCGCSEYLGTQ